MEGQIPSTLTPDCQVPGWEACFTFLRNTSSCVRGTAGPCGLLLYKCFQPTVEKVGQRVPGVLQAVNYHQSHWPASCCRGQCLPSSHTECVSQCFLQTGGNKKQPREVVKVTCDTVPLTLKNSSCVSWRAESGMGQVTSPG